MLYSVLYNCRCYTIVDHISLNILLVKFSYSINWHCCSFGEGTELSYSEHLSPEETITAYWLRKQLFL